MLVPPGSARGCCAGYKLSHYSFHTGINECSRGTVLQGTCLTGGIHCHTFKLKEKEVGRENTEKGESPEEFLSKGCQGTRLLGWGCQRLF